MNCPHCDHPNTAERNYCGGCGTPLAQYCRRCGFRNLVRDRFCGGCGASCAAEERRETPVAGGEKAVSEPTPVAPAGDPALAELLDAARESAESEREPEEVRVSQDDIDSLFGD